MKRKVAAILTGNFRRVCPKREDSLLINRAGTISKHRCPTVTLPAVERFTLSHSQALLSTPESGFMLNGIPAFVWKRMKRTARCAVRFAPFYKPSLQTSPSFVYNDELFGRNIKRRQKQWQLRKRSESD